MSLRAPQAIPFEKGLHEIGNGHFAYLLPTGTWGFSNAGFILDGGESLLVDTLFDERLTREMLDAIRRATGVGAADIATLVNTHANGDHTFGNRLVDRARIIASSASAAEMAHGGETPEVLSAMMKQTGLMGDLGVFLQEIFGPFDFAGAAPRFPDQTFVGEQRLRVGDKEVVLIEVGPAHTAGDTLVHVPADRVVYTGDILFIESTPIMWRGPIQGWIAACDRILAMDVEVIVPGHGPVTDKAGVGRVRSYLVEIEREVKKRHEAGLSAWEAAQDLSRAELRGWADAERIAVTVDRVYRELNADPSPPDVLALFGKMAELRRRARERASTA